MVWLTGLPSGAVRLVPLLRVAACLSLRSCYTDSLSWSWDSVTAELVSETSHTPQKLQSHCRRIASITNVVLYSDTLCVCSWRTWRTSSRRSRPTVSSLTTSSRPTTFLRAATWLKSRRHLLRWLAWWVLVFKKMLNQQLKIKVLHAPFKILCLYSVRPRLKAARHESTSEWNMQTSRRGRLMRRRWRRGNASLACRWASVTYVTFFSLRSAIVSRPLFLKIIKTSTVPFLKSRCQYSLRSEVLLVGVGAWQWSEIFFCETCWNSFPCFCEHRRVTFPFSDGDQQVC